MQQGYKDLKVYERSYKAALAIYRMTEKFPKEERYGLISQIQRAAVSIPLNIAEGYAKDLKMLTVEAYEKARAEYQEIGKMLNGLIKTITKSSI